MTAEESFDEMSSDINSLLSTFKTNMMNNGVVVESGDKFKQLIEKIKGLTEGEGNKGIQYAEGMADSINYKNFYRYENNSATHRMGFIEISIPFEPTLIYAYTEYKYVSNGGSNYTNYTSDVIFDNIKNEYTSAFIYTYTDSINLYRVLNEYNNGVCHLPVSYAVSTESTTPITTCHWYAIGVGEEDTTLRDSLASILQDEGVSVTEEDDMASLISKVDEEFDNKNITDISMGTQKLTWTVYSNEWIELSLNHSCGKIPKLVSIGFFDYKTELSNKYHTDENNYAVHKPTGLTNIYHFYISSITNDTIFLKMRYSNFNSGSSSHGVTAHYILVY